MCGRILLHLSLLQRWRQRDPEQRSLFDQRDVGLPTDVWDPENGSTLGQASSSMTSPVCTTIFDHLLFGQLNKRNRKKIFPETARGKLLSPTNVCGLRCHRSQRAGHSALCAPVELDTDLRRGADCSVDGTFIRRDVRMHS